MTFCGVSMVTYKACSAQLYQSQRQAIVLVTVWIPTFPPYRREPVEYSNGYYWYPPGPGPSLAPLSSNCPATGGRSTVEGETVHLYP